MLLNNKTAIVYGAGGSIGGAVAKAFAREGARVFLAGRTLASLEVVAEQIKAAGGAAEAVVVDAMDEGAVEKEVNTIVAKTGRLDISFNIIGLGDAQGELLVDMSLEKFLRPTLTAMRSHFITATAAAKPMRTQGSGVIMAITANASRLAYPNAGGFGASGSAVEGLCRQLAVELGPQNIRVICLRSAGSPDSEGVNKAFHLHANNACISFEEFEKLASVNTMLKRLPMMAEVANVAAFMASDQASAMTASVVNLTCGMIAD